MSDYPNYPPQVNLPQTSTMAIISLIAGILSWFLLPIVGAIVAVITGHMAKTEIRQSNGHLTGDGLATAGLILGYLHLAIVLVACCAIAALLAMGITLPIIGSLNQ